MRLLIDQWSNFLNRISANRLRRFSHQFRRVNNLIARLLLQQRPANPTGDEQRWQQDPQQNEIELCPDAHARPADWINLYETNWNLTLARVNTSLFEIFRQR